ncbi:MAG: sulfite exporter TauE/SafE family protein [Actinobacteria bacterium]|nr:sulfite exporter TauE/SafE family protein [Actinomycetota bacterium]
MTGALSWEQVLIAVAAAVVAAAIQGSIGFGFSLVVVPTLTLIEPRLLPAAILLVALPMTIFLTYRERHAVDLRGLALTSAGRIFGTGAGLWLLTIVPDDDLAVLMGSIILVAVVVSAFAPDFESRSGAHLSAGVASGVMGTAAALGGPPLALAYQSRPGPVLRATLSASFVIGALMSLTGLLIVGRIDGSHARLAVELLPGVALGLWLSKRTIHLLDRRWLRPAILIFAGAAGIVTVVTGISA